MTDEKRQMLLKWLESIERRVIALRERNRAEAIHERN